MSAIKYLGSLKEYIRSVDISSESSIFRLHYQFTVAVLIGSSVLLTVGEFFGNPIACLSNIDQKNVINTYCWIKSTFTIADYQTREYGEGYFVQPGVGPNPPPTDEELNEERVLQDKWRRHNYYQWVVFFLCFQAALCYLPKFVWSMVEGNLMSTISAGLKRKELYKDENSDVDKKKRVLINYIVSHIKCHDSYVFKYWFCELLCFVNIIGQLFLIDEFLGNEFLNYGLNVMEYSNMDQDVRMDPMIYVFPRMTKCTFRTFGTSGTIQKHDAFCILPLNIFNEKVFIFIWFWFVILAILLSGLILYRIALLALPGLRPRVMQRHNRSVPLDTLETFSKKTDIGDWWIMHILSKNIDQQVYKDIMSKLAKEIDSNSSNNAYNNPGHYSSSSV